MISKELLSEVLKSVHKVTSIEDLGNKISYKHITEYDKELHSHINIHELAHKVKEWASNEGYDLMSGEYYGSQVCKSGNEEIIESADTEPEAIFKAGAWILENR